MNTPRDSIEALFEAQQKAMDPFVSKRLDKLRKQSSRSNSFRGWLVPALMVCGATVFMTTQSYAIEPMPLADAAEFELLLSDELMFVAIRDDLLDIETNMTEKLDHEDGEKQ